MRIVWKFTREDIKRVQEIVSEQADCPFVQARKKRNLATRTHPVKKAEFWEAMVGCLFTSQQRSGPESSVTKFLGQKPFPLGLAVVGSAKDPGRYLRTIVGSAPGIRFKNNLARYMLANLELLNSNEWKNVDTSLRRLMVTDPEASKEVEGPVADSLAEKLKGIGPKQSRNLLQSLGLSRFEIPIDSRITRWLNKAGFPVVLSADLLSDTGYYHFVSQGIQELCAAADVYPCILDAAVFSSFDKEPWTEDGLA